MVTSPITTPAQAQQILDLSNSQFNTIRSYFGINDFPYQPDRTYIVFDADVGNNNLHIDTGTSKSYSILKGDGTIVTSYTDTGGTKILNYAIAGRYLITIDGTFNGIDTAGASAGDKEKYIGIIGGSNYPVNIVNDAFRSCKKIQLINFNFATSIEDHAFWDNDFLQSIEFPAVTSIGDYAFQDCDYLQSVNFPVATSIGEYVFFDCKELQSICIPIATSIGHSAFRGCDSLQLICFPAVTSIGVATFLDCYSLQSVNFPAVTNIGISAFQDCSYLTYFAILYSAGLTIGATAFQNVKLSDLYPNGAANSTEATAIETKLTTAGMTQLNAYRLLY